MHLSSFPRLEIALFLRQSVGNARRSPFAPLFRLPSESVAHWAPRPRLFSAIAEKVAVSPPRLCFANVERSAAEAAVQQPTAEAAVPQPTSLQLRRLFIVSAVPFVAFGIVDQTVLIHAGDLIDNTVGLWFGLPTLAAAACGQVCSDATGVLFGGTIEALAMKLGLPLPGLTGAQRKLGVVSRTTTLGGFVGIVTGCLIGLCNLFFIDFKAADRAKEVKQLRTIMQALLAHGRTVVNSDRATLWVVDEEKDELWSQVAEGVAGQISIPYKAGGSIAALTASNREIVNIPNLTTDSRWSRTMIPAEAFGYEPESMLCVPVVADGNCTAVIQVMNKRNDAGDVIPFDKADEKLMHMLGQHVKTFMKILD